MIPLSKVKDPTDVESYRPTALTTTIGKLLGHMIAYWVSWCVEECSILCPGWPAIERATCPPTSASGCSYSSNPVRHATFLHHSMANKITAQYDKTRGPHTLYHKRLSTWSINCTAMVKEKGWVNIVDCIIVRLEGHIYKHQVKILLQAIVGLEVFN